MTGHGAKFPRKIEQAIAAILTQRNIEEAAKAIGVSTKTLLRWMKDPKFDAELRKARRAAYGQCTARLHQVSSAAVSVVAKIMLDGSAPASARLRAADIVLEHTAKAIEIEDIEVRVVALERAAEAAK